MKKTKRTKPSKNERNEKFMVFFTFSLIPTAIGIGLYISNPTLSLNSSIFILVGCSVMGIVLYFRNKYFHADFDFDEINLSFAFFTFFLILGFIYGAYTTYKVAHSDKTSFEFTKDFGPTLVSSLLLVVGYLLGKYLNSGNKNKEKEKLSISNVENTTNNEFNITINVDKKEAN